MHNKHWVLVATTAPNILVWHYFAFFASIEILEKLIVPRK